MNNRMKYRFLWIMIPFTCIIVSSLITLYASRVPSNREEDLRGQNAEVNNKSIGDTHYNFAAGNDIPVMEIHNAETVIIKDEMPAEDDLSELNANINEQKTESSEEMIISIRAASQEKPEEYNEEQKHNAVTPKVNEDSEVIMALRSFYTLLVEEQYDKAYSLLDEKFKLSAFKILGSSEISKCDIDINTFSEFLKALGIFKTLKIDRILEERFIPDSNEANNAGTKEKVCQIYYYQSFSMENAENISMPLIATLKTSDTGWKITAFEDGDITSKE